MENTNKAVPQGYGFNAVQPQDRQDWEPIVEQCVGCDHVVERDGEKVCSTYASPEHKWQLGLCNFATHKKVAKASQDPKVNPLKASKRASRGG